MKDIEELLKALTSLTISRFHDEALATHALQKGVLPANASTAWLCLVQNHENNCRLWDQEDQARRRDVSDNDIANNKRAIDKLNQQRNDAVERIDEALLLHLNRLSGSATRFSQRGAWRNDRPSLDPKPEDFSHGIASQTAGRRRKTPRGL